MTKASVKENVRSYFFITFGLFIFALGWTAFLIPSEIVGGGVSGIGSLIFYAFDIPVGYSAFIVNVFLVLIGMRYLGANFGINTIYGIAIGALFFIVLQNNINEAVVKDEFMSALLGGILSGAGIGIAFSHGGNSGGTDIIALLVNKYYNISPGRVILYLDVIIIGSSYLIFHSLEKIVYGYVVIAVVSYTIDMVLEGSKQSYQLMIISDHYKEIADRIGNELGRGITFLRGKGWYNQKDREVLLVFARKQDKQNILRIIQETDDSAFLSVAKVMGVFGQNFEQIKI